MRHSANVRFRPIADIRTSLSKCPMEMIAEAARELEADEDEGRWEERLRKVARQKSDKPE